MLVEGEDVSPLIQDGSLDTKGQGFLSTPSGRCFCLCGPDDGWPTPDYASLHITHGLKRGVGSYRHWRLRVKPQAQSM